MRGLRLFISDIRKCRSKEEEAKRIFKELANIRAKFNGHRLLKGYDRKKYLCKLIYIFFLGHKCDLGEMEAVNLLSSNAYSEKEAGYLFISVIMDEENKFAPLIVNALKDDLSSANRNFQNLALKFVSNSTNKTIGEQMIGPVFDILTSAHSPPFLKQTAALTYLALLRLSPSNVSSAQLSEHLVPLLSHPDLGLATTAASLVDWMTSQLPAEQGLCCVKPAVARLHRLVSTPADSCGNYVYYGVPAPWLLVRLLRILQKFPAPVDDASTWYRYKDGLEMILSNALTPTRNYKGLSTQNAIHAVTFEAVRTIVETKPDPCLLSKAINVLSTTLQNTDQNFRLISLELMVELSGREEVKNSILKVWEPVLGTLQSERDVCLRKRAMDLLCIVCDEGNVRFISEEMINFIKEERQSNVREEVVLKLSSLARRFHADLKWYVETVFEILRACEDDAVEDSVWFSMVKAVSRNQAVYAHAARTAFAYLSVENCPDVIVKVAGYILGEFGHVVNDDPAYCQAVQLSLLQTAYPKCSSTTRALLLTTFMKFVHTNPGLRDRIQAIFKETRNIRSEDVEIQQRAVEYLKLSEMIQKSQATAASEGFQLQNASSDVEDPKTKEEGNAATARGPSTNPFVNDMIRTNDPMNCNSGGFSPSISEVDGLQQVLAAPGQDDIVPIASNSDNNALLITMSEGLSPAPLSPLSNNSLPQELPKPLQPVQDSAVPLNPNLMYQQTGVLYDGPELRVLLRKEFDNRFGTLHLLFTNKSEQPLEGFTTRGNFAGLLDRCRVWFSPGSQDIQPGDCALQSVRVECLREFAAKPSLALQFHQAGQSKEVKLVLPLTMYMFVRPLWMSAAAFLHRWHHLDQSQCEVSSTFPAKFPMLCEIAKAKLRGFHLAVVEGVFESPNVVGSAGTFHSRAGETGFLVVLDCLLGEKKYRMAVRSEQRVLATCVSSLLYELL